jgi:hypothetical protein
MDKKQKNLSRITKASLICQNVTRARAIAVTNVLRRIVRKIIYVLILQKRLQNNYTTRLIISKMDLS